MNKSKAIQQINLSLHLTARATDEGDIRIAPRIKEYSPAAREAQEAAAYYTTDPEDALATALAMEERLNSKYAPMPEGSRR